MNDHDHRGEYASDRHDHDIDYAEKHHRHYDDERAVGELQREVRELGAALAVYARDLSEALGRIRQLEQQTPQARQLQLEADQAAADLAESGYDRDEPEDESWRSTLADYAVASGAAEYDDEEDEEQDR